MLARIFQKSISKHLADWNLETLIGRSKKDAQQKRIQDSIDFMRRMSDVSSPVELFVPKLGDISEELLDEQLFIHVDLFVKKN